MKRALTLALVAVCLTAATPAHALAKGDRWQGPCSDWWLGEHLTPAIWAKDPTRGEQMMDRLIVCTFAVWAPGQSVKALYIADRESSDYPWAYNPSGASGLFQHMASLWPGRVDAYLWPGWFSPGAWPPSPMDPRANAIVAARMVGSGGNWGPWS